MSASITTLRTPCPLVACEAEAVLELEYDEPEPSIGHRGGLYLIGFQCEAGHTHRDVSREVWGRLSEPDLDHAQGALAEAHEAARDAHYDAKYDDLKSRGVL